MSKKSAGLLLFRQRPEGAEVLLVHPGGPFWARKDEGAWSIPKGEFGEEEDPLAAAMREFEEETGARPAGEFVPLEPLKQPGGKLIFAWALGSDFDPASLKSNTFSMEWPPRSGRTGTFPEVDRAAFFNLAQAKVWIIPAQVPLLEELVRKLG